MSVAGPPVAASEDTADWGPQLRQELIVLCVVPAVAVALRFWSRAVVFGANDSRRFWWDDWTALAAVPFVLGTNIVLLLDINTGFGRHAWTLTPDQLHSVIVHQYALYFPHPTALCLSKLSAVFFYARVFTTMDRKFRIALWAVGGFVVVSLVVQWFQAIFECWPVAKAYDPTIEGHCDSEAAAYWFSTLASVFADLAILVLPLPMLWRLRLDYKQKLLLTGIFVCGYGVIVVSIGRIVAYSRVSPESLAQDPTGVLRDTVFWLVLEGPLTLFCVCLPAIFKLVRLVVQHGPQAVLHGRQFTHRSSWDEERISVSGSGQRQQRGGVVSLTVRDSNHSLVETHTDNPSIGKGRG